MTEKDHIQTDTKIEIDEKKHSELPRGPPPPYSQDQRYYYVDSSYNQRQTPAYQQRVGGQNVYIIGGPPQPIDVSRGQTAYRVNRPEDRDSEIYRNSEIFVAGFDTIAIRNRFVQRVYTILSLQLLVSFLFILLVTFEEHVRQFFTKYYLVILIISMVVFMSLYIALVCCVDLRRRYPTNFVLLFLLTVSMTLMISCFVSLVPPVTVLAAMGTTALVTFLVSIFACQTKWDVTGCGMCLCIAMIILMVYGLIIMILALVGIYIPILHIIFSALACLLFCFYLMYDTQMVVGGRRVELSPEEYIFGALQLYVDIMQIFMHILVLYQYCMGSN